jgi:hypothetical protein
MPSVTPRSQEPAIRAWTGYSGPVTSPLPVQEIYGANIVQKVVKAVIVSNPIEAVMPRGTILALDATSGKYRVVTDAADDIQGILLEDLHFVADDTGLNIVDCPAAMAKTGNFLESALVVGVSTPPGLTVAELLPTLRRLGIFAEGASV